MTVQSTVPQRRIQASDLEAKFRELKGDVDDQAQQAKGYAIAAGVAVVVAVVTVAFLLGKRRGRKKNTFIEVRRV
jgi:hypothetical protein